MIRLICVGWLLLLFSPAINAQGTYSCVYSDTLMAKVSEKQVDSIRSDLSSRGLPKQLIDGVISSFFEDPNRFLTVQERKVLTRNDSSFVTLDYVPNAGQVFTMKTKNQLIVKGKVYRYSDSLEEYLPSRIPDSSQFYSSTHRLVNILGYPCEEYESADGKYKIWVTQKLPASINPGIPVSNVMGCILGFEAKGANALSRSVIKSVEKVD
jgi:hypothetical protein